MYGPLPYIRVMILNIMLFLSNILQNTHGFVHLKENSMSITFLSSLNHRQRTTSIKKSSCVILTMGEYQALSSYLSSNGISYLTSPSHTSNHNRYSERRLRHILETCLSLLSHAFIPLSYWLYAFSTAVYLINRLPTPTLQLLSPYAKLFGTILQLL